MIIIGYQGIGKSSISNIETGCINLEPGCFWYKGERIEHWLVLYCNTALHLSSQGYTVLITGYEDVINYMRHFIKNDVIVAVFPDLELKDEWTQRLRERATQSGLQKDLDAYNKALEDYDQDIKIMQSWGGKWFSISSLNYDLLDIVKFLKNANKEEQRERIKMYFDEEEVKNE